MRLAVFTVAALLFVPALHAAAPPPALEVRLAAQNALFEEQWQAGLRNNPERATAIGDYRYNDKLGDYSLTRIQQQNADNKAYLARLEAIDTTGFPEQDLLSHQLMLRSLQVSLQNYDLKEYEMSVNQQNGIHTSLSDLPSAVPLDTVQHYDDYIARLHQIPRVLAQVTAVLRLGIQDGLVPPRFILEKVAVQATDVATKKPFLNPIKKIPASFSDADRQRITAAIQQAVDTEVSPAYTAFATFVTNDYVPHGRNAIGVSSLPDGKHRYEVAVRQMTTTTMTPAQIHQLGLDEIKRIQAEMTVIAHKAGYKDLDTFREAVKTNPKYTPTSEEQILDTFRHYIAQMQPRLPELFNLLPDCPVTVEAIPSYQSGAATHYQTGTPNCSRPGRVSVATSDFAHRSLIDSEATAYHEGIPGHHMQRSVQQQLKGPAQVSPLRRRLHRLHRRLGTLRRRARQGDRLLPGPRLRLRSPLLRTLPRRPPRRRHRHPLRGLEPRPGRRILPQVLERRRARDPARDRPLHRLAWTGPRLQDRPAQVPRAPRPRQETARPQVRHPLLPRRDALRRRPATGSARQPHQPLDQEPAQSRHRSGVYPERQLIE